MRRLALAFATVALVACGGSDDPTDPGGVNRIVVTADATSLLVGATMQASATALESDGDPVTSVTFTWRSTNASVATVTNTGLITAVSPGETLIEATAAGKTGSLRLTVDVNRCTTPLTLSVGEVRTMAGATAVSCITLAASTSENEFIFVAAHGGTQDHDVRQVQVTTSLGGVVGQVQAARTAEQVMAEVLAAREAAAMAEPDRLHAKVMGEGERLRRIVPRDARLRPAAPGASVLTAVMAAAAPGDTIPLNVTKANSANLCTNFEPIQAELKATGRKVRIFQDINAPAGGFTAADFTDIAREFDDLIYPTDTLWFGSPTDINSDGRITILYTPEVNKLTPRCTSGTCGFTAGFFWPGDLFKKSEFPPNQPCPATNEQEIFYLLAPDPAGQFGDARTTAAVRQSTRGTIAHEFQHMINQGVRQFNPAVEDLEVAWLNEGMSHIAEEVVGRAKLGYSDFQELRYIDVNPGTNQDDYRAWFQQNLLRFRLWMVRPDTSSPTSNRAANQLAPRGAAWAFVRQVADHHSGNNARNFFRRLAAGPSVGIPNLVEKAGVSFDQMDAEWLVANWADNRNVTGLDTRFTYRSWNMFDAMANASGGNFPLVVNVLPSTITTQVVSGSGTYYRLVRAANTGTATFRMTAPGGGVLGFEAARVHVLRVR